MNSWVLLNAILVSLSCSLAGVFLVIRHRAMLSDAISHAVLPGLVLAFLISGSRATTPMLIGAFVFGLLCIIFIDILKKRLLVKDDAATGIVFTSFFALGIILISKYAGQTDLDQECVLHGEILFSGIRKSLLLGTPIPNATLVSGVTLLAVLLCLRAFYGPLKIMSFQPDYAATMGFSIVLWNYVITGLVSAVTVISFESVGAILVIALMVVPAATAWIISKRLPELLWKTAVVAIAGSIIGVRVGFYFNVSIAGAIAMSLGGLFLMVVVVRGRWIRFM